MLENQSVTDSDVSNNIDHENEDIDPIQKKEATLKQLADVNAKAAMVCKSKTNNPNYLSITYANSKFFDIFGVSEVNLIGKSYDFLFEDFDVGYSNEFQLEYIRLVKDVKECRPCSIIAELKDHKPDVGKVKVKIDYNPIDDDGVYSTFTFENFDSLENPENEAPQSKEKDVGLLKNLERALHNERLLREISYLVVSDRPLREISENIAKSVCQYLKVDRCLIHDFKNGATSFVAEYCNSYVKPMFGGNADAESLNKLTRYINFQNRFHKKVLKESDKSSLVDISSVAADSNFASIEDLCKEYAIGAQITVITSFHNKVNGGLYIHQADSRNWTVDEIDLINMVADQLSLAIDRSDSIERVMIANHELLEKTQQLKEALKEEKNMRQMQNEFVALVSHEFKTPLQIIDSTRELLSRKIKSLKVENESIDKSLDKIKSGIQRMNGLIHSTLNLAKMESGTNNKITLERAEFDLKAFVLDIIEKNSNLAQNKNIQVKMNINDLPETFYADSKLLDHSLTNIISNAIKYSKNDSTVKVLAKSGSKKLLIKVIDQGIGIPQDDLKNIGQKFFRAKNSLAVAGTGIGLYLTKYFIELHGGDVLIESEVNVGTSVTAVLPIISADKE